jgi:hypothetical protein
MDAAWGWPRSYVPTFADYLYPRVAENSILKRMLKPEKSLSEQRA